MSSIQFKSADVVEEIAELVEQRDELADLGADTGEIDARLAQLVCECGTVKL